MIVLLSPHSRILPDGRLNPKNYPYFPEVIKGIKKLYPESKIIQVTTTEHPKIDEVDDVFYNLTMHELKQLLDKSETFISVDNFFHHFAAYYGKMGIVIFTVSDPRIFGHPIHFNIYKDIKYFRPNQYDIWELAPELNPNDLPYIEPQKVIDVFVELINFKRRQK